MTNSEGMILTALLLIAWFIGFTQALKKKDTVPLLLFLVPGFPLLVIAFHLAWGPLISATLQEQSEPTTTVESP